LVHGTATTVREDQRFRERTISEISCAIWMSTDHTLARMAAVPLSALAGVVIADADPETHPVYGDWLRSALRGAGVAPSFAAPSPDTPTGLSRIIDGTTVSLAGDILADGAIAGLAVRPVSDPIRWRWVTTMLEDAPTEAGLLFTAWAIGRSATDRPPP